MDGLSADVQLLAAPAQLEGDGEAPICGNVTLTGRWDGRSMSCDFSSEQTYTTLPPIEPIRLEIRDGARNTVAAIKVRKPLNAGLQSTLFGDVFEASLVPQEEHVHVMYDREPEIKEVVAHLLNVPSYKGTVITAVSNDASTVMPARLRFTGNGWRINIDNMLPWVFQHAFRDFDKENPRKAAESQLWRNRYKALAQVRRTGGTLITALRIERENGATFGLNRATKVLARLETFLSFVFGRRTRPLYACGYDIYGSQNWVLLDVQPPLPTSSAPPFTPSWLPQVSSLTDWEDSAYSGVDLSSAFEGFMSLASEDPGTLTILARAIDWYEAALASFGSPASVVLAQAGLELLAWRRITAEMRLSEKGRSNLDTADQLRLLLSGTELTLDIPVELLELSKAKLPGPVAVTRARNAVVHPIDNSGLTKEQTVEAQSLALWYFEMLLLRMIGYNGEYWDRLGKENRIVPWR